MTRHRPAGRVMRRYAGPGSSIATATAGWAWLGAPAHLTGLAVLCLTSLLAWPLLAMTLVYAPAITLSVLVPARWRKEYRRWRYPDRAGGDFIPAAFRRAVLAADRHRCLFCTDPDRLQIDHGFPWSEGGVNAWWNLYALCRTHNLIKSNYAYDGRVYRSFRNYDNMTVAAQIRAAEKRAAWNMARWLRLAWSLS